MLVNEKIIVIFVTIIVFIFLMFYFDSIAWILVSIVAFSLLYAVTSDKLKLAIIVPIAVTSILLSFLAYTAFMDKESCQKIEEEEGVKKRELEAVTRQIAIEEGKESIFQIFDSKELNRLQEREEQIQEYLDELTSKKSDCKP